MATTLEERQARKEHFSRGEVPAFILFEGACPNCFDDVEVLKHDLNETWFEFHCKGCSTVHYIERTAGGDWA